MQREAILRSYPVRVPAGPRGQSDLRAIRRGRAPLAARADTEAEEESDQGGPPGAGGQGLSLIVSLSQQSSQHRGVTSCDEEEKINFRATFYCFTKDTLHQKEDF